MAIIQCPNNHYYDNKRTAACPYCEKMKNAIAYDAGINEQMTSYIKPIEPDDNAQLTEGYGEAVTEFEKTIGIFVDETSNMLTAAWLVCVEGKEKGKSYVIHQGRNFAGRSCDMDIALSDDNAISREKHFSIVYEPRSITFYLVSGAGRTYVNNEVVLKEKVIVDGDLIQAGQSKYIFVPFCKEGREWG